MQTFSILINIYTCFLQGKGDQVKKYEKKKDISGYRSCTLLTRYLIFHKCCTWFFNPANTHCQHIWFFMEVTVTLEWLNFLQFVCFEYVEAQFVFLSHLLNISSNCQITCRVLNCQVKLSIFIYLHIVRINKSLTQSLNKISEYLRNKNSYSRLFKSRTQFLFFKFHVADLCLQYAYVYILLVKN